MNKIRNWIYNYSDVLLALVIVVGAAAIIWTRIAVIMAYPNSDHGNGENNPSILSAGDTQPSDLGGTDPFLDDEEKGMEPVVPPLANDSDFIDEESNPADEDTPLETDTTITITIPEGSSSTEIAAILKSKNIIPDMSAFLNTVTSLNKEGQLQAGTFTIQKGCTVEELITLLSE